MKNNKSVSNGSTLLISNAQIEVWEMKDKINQSVKNLSIKSALYKILENSQKSAEYYMKSRTI